MAVVDVFTLKTFSMLAAVIAMVELAGVHGDICALKPCHSDYHVCTALSESNYECTCRSGCSGNDCTDCTDLGDITPTACDPNPCKRDCRCVPSCQHSGGYYCRSDSGFLGKNCSVPMPNLRCEPDKMILSVSESFVNEYDMGLRNSFVSVAPSLHQHSRSMCEITTATNGVYEMVIPLPFNACGTIYNDTGDSMVFSNQMWFNRHLTNAFFDMPIPAAEFKCAYNRVYKLVTSLKPVVSTPNVVSSQKDIFPTISLCKVPSCPASCPQLFRVSGGAAYTVGEMIHVTMSLDSGTSTTGVAEMYLSCSRDLGSPRLADIVKGGCNAGSDLPSIIRSTFSSHIVCVSFQTPRFQRCNEFFIHAELQTCASRDTEMCRGSNTLRCRSSRSKRSTIPFVVLGPLVVLNGSTGESSVTINGMEDFPDLDVISDVIKEQAGMKPSHAAVASDSMVIIFCVAAAVLFIVAIVLVYYRRRTSCD